MPASPRSQTEPHSFGSYVLMSAAHNEESLIEGALRSVLNQTVLPKAWAIVNDNSSDGTADILNRYAQKYDFIRVLHVTRAPGRNFGAKGKALQYGAQIIEGLDYEFIGNVDADVSLEPFYFEILLRNFELDPGLGLAGGFLYEDCRGKYRCLRINDVHNVFHGAQLVRRRCYESIGGYAVLKYGGEDWYAQTRAKMNGWRVKSFPGLKIFHHRHTTGGSTQLRNAFRLGRLDYSFGSDPLFEFLKCLRRIPERPYLGNALARLTGFIWPHLCREPVSVPQDFASFLRREQRQRILRVLQRGSVVHSE